MFLSKQEGIRFGAQVGWLDLSKSVNSSSKLTGEKAEYTGIGVDKWVDVLGACAGSLLNTTIFSGK